MRKITKCLAAALALLLLLGAIPAAAKPMQTFVPEEYIYDGNTADAFMDIIADGESDYVIVRGAQAQPSEVTAAEKLQEYLKRISGCELPIVTDEAPARGKEIIVGNTNRAGVEAYQVTREELGDDGFIIQARGDGNILIAGGEKRGTLYGVFDFLEKFLGCRWFSPEMVIIPETKTVTVPAEIDMLEVPAFLYRSPQIIPAYYNDTDYCLANRTNGHAVGAVADEKYGGVVDYDLGNIAGIITHDAALYSEHPDWFAVNEKGERVFGEYGSPCMSNEEVIQFYTAYALEHADLGCIGMSHNDTSLSCQCENCKAIYREEGTLGKTGESGATLVRMLNRISDALDEVGSDAKFGILAYAATIEAPQKTKLTDRTIVYFAPIGACYAHPFETDTYKGTVNHRRQLEDWVKVASNFVQFDYPCNYDHWNLPYPLWAALQPNIQYFYENKFIGWFNCGGAACDTSFFPMTSWLYAKLLWNPYRDMDALYADFLPKYYGEGWQYIREYIRIMSEKLTGRTSALGIGRHFERTAGAGKKGLLSVKNRELKYIDELWANAKALAKEDWQLTNLRRAEVSWRVWKADSLRGEFSLFKKRTANNRQLLSDIWELGLTTHGFDHIYVTVEESERLHIYNLTPRYWTGRMLGYNTIGGIDNDGNDRGPGKAKNFPQLVWGWIFD